jgi:hypothetical protein
MHRYGSNDEFDLEMRTLAAVCYCLEAAILVLLAISIIVYSKRSVGHVLLALWPEWLVVALLLYCAHRFWLMRNWPEKKAGRGLQILVVLLALPNAAMLVGLFSQALDESEYLLLHLVVALIGAIPVAFGAIVTLLAAFRTSPLRQDDAGVLSA